MCLRIQSKYEHQDFLKPSLRILSSNSSSLKASLSRKTALNNIPSTKGMVEFIGVLKITVVKGTNLAVRDMLSSDPYVVLTLGQQKAQTTVRNSNLNPVWNEELMLSVPQNYKPVKVVATRAGSESSVLHYMGRLNAWADPQTLFYK
ncbi:putative ADP-ribosylation factor GTPase-activating protein AGD11/12/13 [Helianthus annuus]|nr:putative ADP-ribosylation factor GTPase-activating protein AGD11/12/13 [Helianthus annuus]